MTTSQSSDSSSFEVASSITTSNKVREEVIKLSISVISLFMKLYMEKTGKDYYLEKELEKQKHLLDKISDSNISIKDTTIAVALILAESIIQVRNKLLPENIFESHDNDKLKKQLYKALRSQGNKQIVSSLKQEFRAVIEQSTSNMVSDKQLNAVLKDFIKATINNAIEYNNVISNRVKSEETTLSK